MMKTKKKKSKEDEELIDNATIDETNELEDLENLDDDLKFHQEMLDIEREKNYKEILTIEIDDIIQGDSRTSNPAIISKLYEREPGIFKSSIGDKRYTRLCQPPQRHPVILTDYEKKN